jgi:uncharacterized protein (TIGR03118 family)
MPAVASAQHYTQTNLVSDTGAPPVLNDPNLKNAWGLVHSATSPWWISNNATGTSTLYDTSTTPPTPRPLVVTVPPAPAQPAPGRPTGVLFSGSATDFLLAPGKQALFIFVTEDGTISGQYAVLHGWSDRRERRPVREPRAHCYGAGEEHQAIDSFSG